MTQSRYGHPIFSSILLVTAGLFSSVSLASELGAAPTALSITGVEANGQLGWSSALSSNGDVALVGAAGGAGVSGAAYVYTQTNGAWNDPVELSESGVPTGNDLGASVALSANGQVALVGAPANGAAYVYTETGGVWSGPVALSTTGTASGNLGYSVALSADGTSAFVGNTNANSDIGAVYVYTYNGSRWSAPTPLSTSGLSGNVQLGSSIALSSNADVALIGAAGNAGALYVYTYNGSSWSAPTKLSESGISPSSLGFSVALSANGEVALAGAPYTGTGGGAAYVYTQTSGTWGNPVTLAVASGSATNGWSVALSPNGETAFVGAPSTNAKVVYAYVYNGSTWSTPISLSASGVPPSSNIGWSIAQAQDGQELLAGAISANGNTGAAYVYESPTPVTFTVSPNPASVVPGHTLILDLSFTNADTAGGGLPAVTLTNLVLTDTLPAGITYVSSNAANGSCSDASGIVTCTLASLPPGSNSQNPWQPSITVTTPTSASQMTNTASMSADEPLTGTSSVSTSILNDVTPTVTDGGVTTTPAHAVSGTLAATPGFPGQNLTFVIVSQPTHGTVTLTDASTGAFTYTPASGFTGTDGFVFTVGDGIVTAIPGLETITVSTTQYLPPVANNLTLSGYAGLPLTGQLSATSSNGHALTYTATSQPIHGTVSVTASTGAFTYTPASGFTGSDSFTFTANDGTSTSNTATVSITVIAAPAASGGGSSSSGKSGGGALGFPALLLFGALLITINVRKRCGRRFATNIGRSLKKEIFMKNSDTQSRVRSRHLQLMATVCAALIFMLSIPSFAAVLSSSPIQLSDYGLQQGQLLGWSLALSQDGQVAAGGAPAYNRSGTSGTDYTGAAYVYAKTGGTWSAPITLSTTGIPTGSFIGGAIAVSSNGQQIIVGAQNSSSQGGVYVYTETGGSWTNTPTRTSLALPASMVGDYFGEGLAVSSNGQILLVGTGPLNGTSQGEIYAYTLSGSTWTNPVPLPMTGIPNGLDMGRVLAVSANGQVVVGGGPQWNNPNGDTAEGAAYVWTQNANGSWKNPVELAYPSTLDSSLSFFGGAVALSADGSEILVGATGANNTIGAAYVYTDTGGTWSSTPEMLSTTMSNAGGFGSSVALSPDGQRAFMGMPVNDTGYVFMSSQTNGTWSTPTALSLANLPVSAFLGIALAQADNGEELLTTGYDVNNDTGALFVYDSPAAITLAGSASSPSVAPSSTLTFDLTLTNADQPGSTPATTLNSVVLTDTLPTGTTFVSSNAANGTCNDAGSTVTCTLISLAPGNNAQNPWTPSITVKTPSTAAALTNTLVVGSDEPLVGATTVNTQITNDVVPTLKSGNLSTATGTVVSGTLNGTPGFTGQALTFTIVSQPSNGTVTLTDASTGAFTYTPNPGFDGSDAFVWTAGDGVVTATPVSESIAVGASGGSGSGSSGKSGGGAFGIPMILLLCVMLITMISRKHRHCCDQRSLQPLK